jgi:protein SCO1
MMTLRQWLTAMVLLLLISLALSLPVSAASGNVAATGHEAILEWASVPLQTAENKTVDLRRDIVQDRLVVMNFIYTRCTSACPLQLALFAQLQKKLGAKMESQVRLVSLSIDPVNDTPERLQQAALQHHAQPGWIWLTGAPSDVQAITRGLGVYSSNPAQHQPALLIGDGRCDRWTRLYGFVAADRILDELKQLESRRGGPNGQCR